MTEENTKRPKVLIFYMTPEEVKAKIENNLKKIEERLQGPENSWKRQNVFHKISQLKKALEKPSIHLRDPEKLR